MNLVDRQRRLQQPVVGGPGSNPARVAPAKWRRIGHYRRVARRRLDLQRHWIGLGFSTLETLLSQSPYTGTYCHGDLPTLADICLIPQMANARRVNLDLAPYPTLVRIEAHTLAHPAFEAALPKNQPDAE